MDMYATQTVILGRCYRHDATILLYHDKAWEVPRVYRNLYNKLASMVTHAPAKGNKRNLCIGCELDFFFNSIYFLFKLRDEA